MEASQNFIQEVLALKCTAHFNPLSANPTKWPNTLKQFGGKLLKGLSKEKLLSLLAVFETKKRTLLCGKRLKASIFQNILFVKWRKGLRFHAFRALWKT